MKGGIVSEKSKHYKVIIKLSASELEIVNEMDNFLENAND